MYIQRNRWCRLQKPAVIAVDSDLYSWKQVMQIVDGRRLQLLQLMIEQGRRPLSDNVDNMYT